MTARPSPQVQQDVELATKSAVNRPRLQFRKYRLNWNSSRSGRLYLLNVYGRLTSLCRKSKHDLEDYFELFERRACPETSSERILVLDAVVVAHLAAAGRGSRADCPPARPGSLWKASRRIAAHIRDIRSGTFAETRCWRAASVHRHWPGRRR